MKTEDRVRETFQRAIAEFTASTELQDLLGGRMTRDQVLAFIRNLFLPHYQSAHIIAFSYALLASDAADLLKENLLEEMGAEEGEEAHPDLLTKLARGAGFSEAEIAGLIAESREQARVFCAQQLPFPTLRDLGLAILLESSSFEHLLSRQSNAIGRALREHYGLPGESLTWFDLHGELDIRHAEESLTTLREYVAFHRIEDAHLDRVMRAVFFTNPFARRYFPTQAEPGPRERAGPAAVRGPTAPDSPLGPGPAWRIDSLTIYRLHIPFREAFRHAQFERSASDAVVVRVRDTQGLVGYGEALAREYVTGEDPASVVACIREQFGPWVFATELRPGDATWDAVATYGREQVYGPGARTAGGLRNAAYCALELALLDCAYRRAGASIAGRIPPCRAEVVYSGVISAEDPTAAAALARRFVEGGIEQLKLKVGVGDDVGRMRAVREAVGQGVRLRADANGAWDVDEAVGSIRALAAFGLECLEQPVSHTHLDHVARLRLVRERSGVPIIADESLATLGDAQALAESGACDMFNVRVSKNGGLAGAVAIAEIASQAGIGVLVGAQVGETALLTAAGRHLAAYVKDLTYAEGSFGTLLLSEDIAEQELRFGLGGVAPALGGLGLGVEVRQEALERLAVETVELRR